LNRLSRWRNRSRTQRSLDGYNKQQKRTFEHSKFDQQGLDGYYKNNFWSEMNIILVRHGETDWNNRLLFQGHTDIPLNKKGICQAKRIGKELSGKHITAIVTSDLIRAVHTAQEIKKAVHFRGEIITDPGFRERNYGSLEGKHYRSNVHEEKFDGEPDAEFFARIDKAFKSTIKKFQDAENIVIVCHGGAVRAVISNILEVKKFKRLRLYNASISEIFYSAADDAFFVTLFNSIAHLTKSDREDIKEHLKGI
jgi:broad specificity phosphatase PhoE